MNEISKEVEGKFKQIIKKLLIGNRYAKTMDNKDTLYKEFLEDFLCETPKQIAQQIIEFNRQLRVLVFDKETQDFLDNIIKEN